MRAHDTDKDGEDDQENNENCRNRSCKIGMMTQTTKEARDGTKNGMEKSHSLDPRWVDDIDDTRPFLSVGSVVKTLSEVLASSSRYDRNQPLNVTLFKGGIDVFRFKKIEAVTGDAIEEQMEDGNDDEGDDGGGSTAGSCVGTNKHHTSHEANTSLNEE